MKHDFICNHILLFTEKCHFWGKQFRPDVWFPRYKAPQVFEGEHHQTLLLPQLTPPAPIYSIWVLESSIHVQSFE
jgi:hypothetical protein